MSCLDKYVPNADPEDAPAELDPEEITNPTDG
jgi:hypothetical protein